VCLSKATPVYAKISRPPGSPWHGPAARLGSRGPLVGARNLRGNGAALCYSRPYEPDTLLNTRLLTSGTR
jgi:hypothetical protein